MTTSSDNLPNHDMILGTIKLVINMAYDATELPIIACQMAQDNPKLISQALLMVILWHYRPNEAYFFDIKKALC